MAVIAKTQAFVLNTMPFKESSLFATLLTKKYGKVTVLAKGCRRPKSRLCGALEIFNFDEIIFYKREFKEIYTLSDAVVLEHYQEIRAHPQKVNGAMVLCEFFEKTLPAEEQNEDSFVLLSRVLEELEAAPETKAKEITLWYVLKALSGAGVMPHLDDCVRCHAPIQATRTINFSIGAGGVVCDKDYDDTVVLVNGTILATLKRVYTSSTISMDNDTCDALGALVPEYLYYHLNNLSLNSLLHLR